MSERNLAVRLALIAGGKVKAELRDVGDSDKHSRKRIEEVACPASKGLQVIDGAARDMHGSLEVTASRL